MHNALERLHFPGGDAYLNTDKTTSSHSSWTDDVTAVTNRFTKYTKQHQQIKAVAIAKLVIFTSVIISCFPASQILILTWLTSWRAYTQQSVTNLGNATRVKVSLMSCLLKIMNFLSTS